MGKIVKNKIEYGGASSGAGVPTGGTTGQALVKKSNTDGDVEWADINIPDGWGVAKSGVATVSIANQSGSFTINIADLGITSVNDYNVVFSIVGGTGEGAWGDAKAFVWGRNTTAISGSVSVPAGDIQTVSVSYVVVAKGFGNITQPTTTGGSSIPAGYSPMQIEMVDSNGVTHTYEFLGKEITP